MIGQTISHYKILEKLGEGGMGVVYKAEDLRLHRVVAMKFLPRELTYQKDAKERFIREAQAASALDHPNICTVYEVDESPDGVSFIVMAYCDGRPLEEKVSRGPLPLPECIDLALQIAEGLKSAHEHDIVHRDLKPANVIATSDGRVRIVDFGLAKLRGRTRLTKERTTLGTIEYMSPEQARGAEVDHRTDIWSLGCLLYEMLTGRTPFRGEYEQAVIYSILNSPPEPVAALRSGIPDDLARIVSRCLEKNPADRYRSAADLAADLRPIRRRLSGTDRPAAGPAVAAATRTWRPAAVAAGLAIAAIAAALLWLLFSPGTGTGTDRKSIAVLPFSDLTGNPGEEYFSDGITDDILTQLYKIGDLRVTSRTTMQKYRQTGKSVKEIGAELGAGAVLEGSVRRSGNRVRIVAQLIDARTDDHLWAETYDRGMEDVFSVQSEIARKIAEALHARLLPEEKDRLASPPPTSAEAYDLILEGRAYALRATAADMDTAIGKFMQALAIDPGNARAWALLATAYARQADIGAVSTDSGYVKARKAAEKAIALDDRLAQGHSIMGWIKRSYDWDWAGAGAECRKAYEIAPGDVMVIRSLAHLEKSLGRFDEAIALLRKASELDPKQIPIFTSIGLLSAYAGRLEDAAAAYRKAVDMNPGYPAAHTFLGLVYLLQGHPEKAIEEIRHEVDEGWRLYGLAQAYGGGGLRAQSDSALRALISDYGEESMYQVAEVYAYRGETDSAFAWLERAYIARDAGLSELKGDPFMKKIGNDPRYVPFMKKMKLPI